MNNLGSPDPFQRFYCSSSSKVWEYQRAAIANTYLVLYESRATSESYEYSGVFHTSSVESEMLIKLRDAR